MPLVALRTPVRLQLMSNMRTLATQVKLRRLIRAFAEARNRIASEPIDRRVVGSMVDRLLELSGDHREGMLTLAVIIVSIRCRPTASAGPLAHHLFQLLAGDSTLGGDAFVDE